MAKMKKPTRVYSYIRFSTAAQGKEGKDSERRQTAWRDEYMARHPTYVLDDELYADRAVSGYSGKHNTRGELAQFLDAIKCKRVQPGSILLVENIDRLTRLETVDAWDLVVGIIKKGVAVQTPIALYDRAAVNSGAAHGLLAEMQRAHYESQRKSELVTRSRDAAFAKLRASDIKILTARCPAWLQTVGPNGETKRADGTTIPAKDAVGFKPIAEAVETIQWIFQMKADGLSQYHIERVLNDGAAWQRPNSWRTSYIKKILGNAAVIGEYQPHRRKNNEKRKPEGPPLEGYYPAIIESELFYTVQAQLAANRGKGGRTGKHLNIFTHIVKCGYCGGSMRYVRKDSKGKRWRYLACDNAARKAGCRYLTVRHPEVVDVVLRGCVYLRPEQVLPSSDEHAAVAAALRERRAVALAELQDVAQQIKNYVAQIGRTSVASMQQAYEARILEHEERAATLETTTAEADTELAKLEHGAKDTREWQRGVAALMGAIQDDEAAETRAKLAAHLRTFIDRIEIFPHGFEKVADRGKNYHEERGELVAGKNGRRRKTARRWWDADVDTIAETLDAAYADTPKPRPTKQRWAEFERYVLGRRMSKEGRFYRVHFKTGERVDLVPQGGLATGWGNVRKGVESVLPDIGKLWQEFEEGRP